MRYLALAVVALAGYIAGRFVERSWWMADDRHWDKYRDEMQGIQYDIHLNGGDAVATGKAIDRYLREYQNRSGQS